jgi:hypothetical protein
MANGTLRGSFSVGGGPAQYRGYKAKPKPTTTTSSVRPTTTTTSVPSTAGAMPKVQPKVKKAPPPTVIQTYPPKRTSTTTTSIKGATRKIRDAADAFKSRGKLYKEMENW